MQIRLTGQWLLELIERTRSAPRHRAFYEVMEALAKGGCPLCRLAQDGVAHYLDLLAYESVNDLDLRRRLRYARGFCSTHAWQFREEIRDGLGTAIIYRDVVNRLIIDLGGRPQPDPAAAWRPRLPTLGARSRATRQDAASHLRPQQGCPACGQQATSEYIYRGTLLAHLAEAEFRDRYARADGLCVPHFVQVLRSVSSLGQARVLLEAQGQFLARWHSPAGKPANSPAAPPSPPADSRRGGGGGRTTAREVLAAMAARPRGGPASDLVASMVGARGMANLWDALPNGESAANGNYRVSPEALAHAQAEEGCPLCRLAQAAVDARLRAPAGEGARESAAGAPSGTTAWCHNHAWRRLDLIGEASLVGTLGAELSQRQSQLAAAQAGFGEATAIVSGPPLLAERATLRRGVQRVVASLEPPHCPACRARAGVEVAYARLLVTGGSAGTAPGATRLSTLCLPHLMVALNQAPGTTAATALVERQIAAWGALRAELGEYIRKHDYRFRHEPWGDEQTAPWRAVEQVAGARGVRP